MLPTLFGKSFPISSPCAKGRYRRVDRSKIPVAMVTSETASCFNRRKTNIGISPTAKDDFAPYKRTRASPSETSRETISARLSCRRVAMSLIEQACMCDTGVLFCLATLLSAQATIHKEVHGGTAPFETQPSLARRVVAEMEAPPVILPCAQRTGQDRCASQCGETANTNRAGSGMQQGFSSQALLCSILRFMTWTGCGIIDTVALAEGSFSG